MVDDWKLSRQYLSPEGIVRYEVAGDGESVVLVHGTPWSSFAWHRLIPTLSKRYRVYYYDLIGYGQSEKSTSQNVSLDVQGKLLVELLRHWDIETPRVIAHDYGGAISLRAHLLHGCDFKSLQLIDVVALSPWGSPFFTHIKKFEKAFSGVPDFIHSAIVKAYVAQATHGKSDDYQFDSLVQPWLSVSGKAAFYRQIAQADERYTDEIQPLYSQVTCPVSILWGENDAWIPIEAGRRLHELMPGSVFEAVPGAGHLAQLENPGFVCEKAEQFLSR